jgi:hypothetical protein
MAIRYGRGLRFGVGIEATWGSAQTRNRFYRGISSNIRAMPAWSRRSVLSRGPNATKMFKGMVPVSGDIEVLAAYEGMGALYKLILGDSSTSGAGPYTHTYVMANTLPSVSLEVVADNEGYAELYTGVMVSKATLSVKAGEEMRLKVSFLAEDELQEQSATSPTYTTNDGSVDVLHYEAGSVGWNSGTYSVYSMEVNLDNKLVARDKLGSTASKQFVRGDYTEIIIKLELDWEAGFNAAWLAGTQSDLSITFTSGSNTFTINLHNAQVIDEGHPVSAVGVTRQTVTLRGLSDGTDEGMSIVVVNGQSSAVAV